MTLLIAVLAAVTATIIWYTCRSARELHIGTLALMYWGASLMWLIDAVNDYLKLHAAYFSLSAADLRNDCFLGISVVTLGLVIWLVIVLVRDPKHVIAELLRHEEK